MELILEKKSKQMILIESPKLVSALIGSRDQLL
jgi:hypothetical protein